jgi:PLP dependent protein
MTDITGNLRVLRTTLPSSVKLVAVSKTRPVSDIMEAYNAGQRYFGENKVQELLTKKDLLPDDIEWHLIGHLQSNKVKAVVPFVRMIQSVDSFKLLETINSEASKVSRIVDCLLQIHIALEETKFGFSMKELEAKEGLREFINFTNVRICGVMGMATFTADTDQVKKEFDYLSKCFKALKNTYFSENHNFKEISMGMSGDYEIAVKEGSSIVRIGSLIFGVRNKKPAVN